MEFEDILVEVGDSGRYQKLLTFVFLIPTTLVMALYFFNVLFMVSVPEHWCNVPEVVMSNLTIEQQRLLISPPSNPKCLMYDINYTDYLNKGIYPMPNETAMMSCTNGWEFDRTYWDATVATKWNMFCEDGHYTSFVVTMYHVGSIIGTPIYGSLSDRIGRRTTYFIILTVTLTSAFASVLMTNFTAFIFFKTINGSLMPSIYQAPLIIVLELIAPETRTRMNGMVNSAWTFGLCFLPLVAWLCRDWVKFGLITSSVIFMPFLYWRFIPESPRWLLSQERYEEAAAILMKVADKNGQLVDSKEILSKLKTCGEKIRKEESMNHGQNRSTVLLRYPRLRKVFLIITFCWIADVMAYYGLQLNLANLAGNEFLNFFLATVVEIPGFLSAWYLMNKFGRRWVAVVCFLLTGLFCMLPAILEGLPHVDIICSMLGKYFVSITYMDTYTQSSELYPTVVRAAGMGMSSAIAMVVSLAIPYIIYLAVYGKEIPFVVISGTTIIAGILATFLPETLNENLPQNINDTETFGAHQKFFSMNRRRISTSRERAASLKLSPTLEINDGENRRRSSQILRNRNSVTSVKISLSEYSTISFSDKDNDTQLSPVNGTLNTSSEFNMESKDRIGNEVPV